MAKQEQWEMVEKWGEEDMEISSCLLELRARVQALEAAQNLRQQDEDVERVAALNPMDSDLLQHFQEALGDPLDRLRAVYDLGRQHAYANSKPTANDRPITSPLVARVASAIEGSRRCEMAGRQGWWSWHPEASEAIDAVAGWLEENSEPGSPCWVAAFNLREQLQ